MIKEVLKATNIEQFDRTESLNVKLVEYFKRRSTTDKIKLIGLVSDGKITENLVHQLTVQEVIDILGDKTCDKRIKVEVFSLCSSDIQSSVQKCIEETNDE